MNLTHVKDIRLRPTQKKRGHQVAPFLVFGERVLCGMTLFELVDLLVHFVLGVFY
jgi:hypothetical protein